MLYICECLLASCAGARSQDTLLQKVNAFSSCSKQQASLSSKLRRVLQIRLVEEDTSYCTYGEAYEVNCARYGRQPDQPIVQFKKRICDERGQLIIDPKGELRQQV